MSGNGRCPVAKITFKDDSEYMLRLQAFEQHFASQEPLKRAVAAGAEVVADQIRANLDKLPEEEYRHLASGETFKGLPRGQKRDLQDSFGLTPIEQDRNGFLHTKAGFEGYGSFPTNAYPDGVPNPLLARSVESGSSVRQKTPFVEPAVKATRKEAVEKMDEVIDNELKQIF